VHLFLIVWGPLSGIYLTDLEGLLGSDYTKWKGRFRRQTYPCSCECWFTFLELNGSVYLNISATKPNPDTTSDEHLPCNIVTVKGSWCRMWKLDWRHLRNEKVDTLSHPLRFSIGQEGPTVSMNKSLMRRGDLLGWISISCTRKNDPIDTTQMLVGFVLVKLILPMRGVQYRALCFDKKNLM